MRWLLPIVFLLGCASTPSTDGGVPFDAAFGGVDEPLVQLPDLAFVTAPHEPFPSLIKRGKGELDPIRIVTIVAANEDPTIAAQLFAFGDAVVTSHWFASFAGDFGISPPSGNVHLTGAAITSGTVMTNALLDSYTTQTIQSAASPPLPDGKTLYVIYLPTGVVSTWAGQPNPDCTAPEGYHRIFGTGGDGLAVIERCPSYATLSGDLDHFTVVGSHEIAEAAVDTGMGWKLVLPAMESPWMASPWVEDEGTGGVENGDLCTGTRIVEGSFLYQRIYTNSAATSGSDPCVPALPIAYYNTTTAQGWYSGAAGATVPVEVTGWSSAPTADWIISSGIASVGTTSTTKSSLAFKSATTGTNTTMVNGKTFHTINNGESVTVNVTIPSDAQSGDWAAIELFSFRFDSQGKRPPAGEDAVHRWIVGVYVP